MEKRIEVVCKNCFYWITDGREGKTTRGTIETTGDCHRKPPDVFVSNRGFFFPDVGEISIGCGEFKKLGGAAKTKKGEK